MTGDMQGGRQAYSKHVINVARTWTALIPCNAMPRPRNPNDTAIVSRMELLTTHHVFHRNEAQKAELEARMTAEQIALAQFKPADATVMPRIESDPLAAAYFLQLLARAWHSLIVDQRRVFVPSPLAKTVSAAFWSSLRNDQDSVSSFLHSNVQRVGGALLPKNNLWLAYRAWYQCHTPVNGSSGTLIKSEQSFKLRIMEYFSHPPLDTTKANKIRVFVRQYPTLDTDWSLLPTPSGLKSKVPCYVGLSLLQDEAYPLSNVELDAEGGPSKKTDT